MPTFLTPLQESSFLCFLLRLLVSCGCPEFEDLSAASVAHPVAKTKRKPNQCLLMKNCTKQCASMLAKKKITASPGAQFISVIMHTVGSVFKKCSPRDQHRCKCTDLFKLIWPLCFCEGLRDLPKVIITLTWVLQGSCVSEECAFQKQEYEPSGLQTLNSSSKNPPYIKVRGPGTLLEECLWGALRVGSEGTPRALLSKCCHDSLLHERHLKPIRYVYMSGVTSYMHCHYCAFPDVTKVCYCMSTTQWLNETILNPVYITGSTVQPFRRHTAWHKDSRTTNKPSRLRKYCINELLTMSRYLCTSCFILEWGTENTSTSSG